MYPTLAANTQKVWAGGSVLTAADRRFRFYDETYPVLLFIREHTPPDAVVLLPPRSFIKETVARRRPEGEDLTPLLAMASSAYSFIYPRVPVHWEEDAPLQDAIDWLLVWEHWGLDRIDPNLPRTDENRVRLFSAPADPGESDAPAARKRLPRWSGTAVEDRAGPDRWITGGLLLGLAVLAAFGEGAYRLFRRAGLLPLGSAGASPRHAEPPPPQGEGSGPLPGRESLRERAGWRVLLALAAVPFVMILLDRAQVPIRAWSLSAAAAAALAAGIAVERRGWRGGDRSASRAEAAPSAPARPASGRGVARVRSALSAAAAYARTAPAAVVASARRAPAGFLLALGAASLVLFSLVQVMLLPERNYDALVGWDLVGKVLAYEGKLVSSVFSRIAYNAQAIYAPFAATSNGFWYVFHPAIPRLWVPLLAGAFLLLFHRRVQVWTGSRTAASLAAFVVFLPQAFLSQLTMAMTDLPSAVYVALGLFAAVDAARGRGGWGAPAVLFTIATASRAENALLGAAVAVAGWAVGRRRARGWRALWVLAAPAAFFLFWNVLYVQVLMGYSPAAHFSTLRADVARVAEILRRIAGIIAMPEAFGEFWLVLAAAPVLWLAWRLGPGRSGAGRGAIGAPVSRPEAAPRAAGGAERERERARERELERELERERERELEQELGRELERELGHELERERAREAGLVFLLTLAMLLSLVPYFYLWDPVLNPLWTMEHTFKRGFFRFIPGVLAAFLAVPWLARLLRRCETA